MAKKSEKKTQRINLDSATDVVRCLFNRHEPDEIFRAIAVEAARIGVQEMTDERDRRFWDAVTARCLVISENFRNWEETI